MLKRMEPYKYDLDSMTDEQIVNFAIAEWIWNSHSWIEEPAGYFNCEWCNATTTNMQAIRHDAPLCRENPAVISSMDRRCKSVSDTAY